MSEQNNYGELLEKNFTCQLEQLEELCCSPNTGFEITYLLEHHLESILNIIRTGMGRFSKLHLSPAKQSRLADACIPLVQFTEPLDDVPDFDDLEYYSASAFDYNAVPRCKLLAMKIIACITKKPILEYRCPETLGEFYIFLLKNLLLPVPDRKSDPPKFRHTMNLKSLSAICLIRSKFVEFESLIGSYDKMIKNMAFPLAVKCLMTESRNDKSTFQDFEHNFHSLSCCREKMGYRSVESHSCRDKVSTGEYEHAYPMMFHLLLALIRRLQSSGQSEYRKELDSRLKLAIESGKIEDQHIVALNIRIKLDLLNSVTSKTTEPDLTKIKQQEEVLIEMLTKSEGLQRAHIAYMIAMFFELNQPSGSDNRTIFATAMIEDLLTKNDELLDEIAIKSLFYDGIRGELSERDGIDLYKLVTGKEIEIMRKLVLSNNLKPKVLRAFLQYFNCFEDAQSSIEFDLLSQIPIAQNINKLHYLVKLKERDHDQIRQLETSLICVENILRLRRHRLKEDEEIKLIEVFGLFDKRDLLDCWHDHGILLVFANRYHVHGPSSWNSVIKFIKSIEHKCDELINPDTANITLSYLLMVDADYFYGEFATPEVHELIYQYCKRAVDLDFYKNRSLFAVSFRKKRAHILLKEILLTWPSASEKTKLDSNEYRTMLTKYIELLINALGRAREKVTASKEPENIIRFVERLSGLVVAFSRHREVLYYVLVSSVGMGYNRDLWLKDQVSTWTELMIDSANQVESIARERVQGFRDSNNADLKGCFRLNQFADIFAAYEGLMVIKSGSLECPELAKSSGALLSSIEIALDSNLKRAPIGSIESETYRELKARLRSTLAFRMDS